MKRHYVVKSYKDFLKFIIIKDYREDYYIKKIYSLIHIYYSINCVFNIKYLTLVFILCFNLNK